MRFRNTVIEEGSNLEMFLEVGKRTSEDINSSLMEGATRLKVQRKKTQKGCVTCLNPQLLVRIHYQQRSARRKTRRENRRT